MGAHSLSSASKKTASEIWPYLPCWWMSAKAQQRFPVGSKGHPRKLFAMHTQKGFWHWEVGERGQRGGGGWGGVRRTTSNGAVHFSALLDFSPGSNGRTPLNAPEVGTLRPCPVSPKIRPGSMEMEWPVTKLVAEAPWSLRRAFLQRSLRGAGCLSLRRAYSPGASAEAPQGQPDPSFGVGIG